MTDDTSRHDAAGERPASRRSIWVDAAITLGLVALVGAVVMRYYPLYHKSLVWKFDGLGQHIPELHFFNEWVRGILRHPGQGIPLWSWKLGLGADILGTLQWPIIGDPFALIGLLFPMKALETAYATMYVARMLCAGVAAALYLRVMRARPLPSAMGALVYVFGTFLLVQGRHPYFITAMVLLPLLLIGIEWALRGRSYWSLTAIVFVAAVANFYFFYIMTIIAIVYAVVRYFDLAEKTARWRELGPTAFRVGGHYALGTLLAAPLLMTAIAAVMQTARSQAASTPPLLWSIHEYGSMLVSLATSNSVANSTFLGYPFLALLLAPIVVMAGRRYSALRFLLIAYVGLVGLPVFGWLFNGMSFPSNRFAFSWGLFLALGVALLLSEDRLFSWRELGVMGAALVAYATAVFVVDGPLTADVWVPIMCGVLTVGVLAGERASARPWRERTRSPGFLPQRWQEPWTRWLLLGVLMVNIVANGTFAYDARYQNLLKAYADWGDVLKVYRRNTGALATKLPQDGFYRVDSGDTLNYNSAIVQGYNGTSFYFSTMNGALSEFKSELDDRTGWSSFAYDGFDDRVMPTTLLGVEYYLSKSSETSRTPFGFDEYLRGKRAVAYRNSHTLPLGFVYHDTIARSDYERLAPVDRQSAMLQGAVVDDAETGLGSRITPIAESFEVTYSVAATDGAVFDRNANTILRTKDKASVELSVAPVEDAELYVAIEDFDNVTVPSKAQQRAAASRSPLGRIRALTSRHAFTQPTALSTTYRANGISKTERWITPESNYYWGNRSQLVNLGHVPSGITTLTISPNKAGLLSFKSLKVIALPLASYPFRIAQLKANGMRDIEITTNRVTGTVSSDSRGILFLSIPYSNGWSAEVDGRPAPVLRVNTGFSGVAVGPGEHRVTLRYFTPGLKPGLMIGVLGLLATVVVALVERRSRRRSISTEA